MACKSADSVQLADGLHGTLHRLIGFDGGTVGLLGCTCHFRGGHRLLTR
jgi:hypothetical protein